MKTLRAPTDFTVAPAPPPLDPARLPRHIAIVMDGNRRWARRHGLRALFGHQRGADTTRMVIETSSNLGVEHLTLYTFSTENWNRSGTEIRGLMRLIEDNLRHELPELHANRVRLRHLGRRDQLPASLLEALDEAVALTRDNTGLVLNLALNYGGRTELVDAARALGERVARGELRPDQIDEHAFACALYTGGGPDPDLFIRTGGELRISNFLPWQIAYAELWVTSTLWPEFSPEEYRQALRDYQSRERRFGSTQPHARSRKGTLQNGHS